MSEEVELVLVVRLPEVDRGRFVHWVEQQLFADFVDEFLKTQLPQLAESEERLGVQKIPVVHLPTRDAVAEYLRTDGFVVVGVWTVDGRNRAKVRLGSPAGHIFKVHVGVRLAEDRKVRGAFAHEMQQLIQQLQPLSSQGSAVVVAGGPGLSGTVERYEGRDAALPELDVVYEDWWGDGVSGPPETPHDELVLGVRLAGIAASSLAQWVEEWLLDTLVQDYVPSGGPSGDGVEVRYSIMRRGARTVKRGKLLEYVAEQGSFASVRVTVDGPRSPQSLQARIGQFGAIATVEVIVLIHGSRQAEQVMAERFRAASDSLVPLADAGDVLICSGAYGVEDYVGSRHIPGVLRPHRHEHHEARWGGDLEAAAAAYAEAEASLHDDVVELPDPQDVFTGDRPALDHVLEQLDLPGAKTARLEPAPAILTVEVADDELPERAAQLREAFTTTGYWPLLVDPSDYDEEMPELIWDDLDEQHIGAAAVETARGLDIDAVLDADELDEVLRPHGSNPPRGVDFVGEDEYVPMLLLVPAAEPWQALAVLGAAAGNSGTPPAEHAAVARWLGETIGAVPVEVGADRIGLWSPAQERSPEQIVEVARRLESYRPTPGWSPAEIAEELTGDGPLRLRFWWD